MESLLSHHHFVRGLAKNLLFDQHLVDDVVQEAWLAALRHPPRSQNSERPWFASVVRHQAARFLELRTRAQKGDRAGAKPEAIPSAIEFSEQEHARREVADAVMALEEPYRTTILLRYFEELPPRKIAARMQLPVDTVYSRLTRAHEKLREILDKKHGGDRRRWALLLVPLAASSKPVAVGAMVATIGLCMSLLIGAGIFLNPGGAKPINEIFPVQALVEPNPEEHSFAGDTELASRIQDPSPAKAKAQEVLAIGRVIDDQAKPMADLPVWVVTGGGGTQFWETTVRTNANGEFRCEVPHPTVTYSFMTPSIGAYAIAPHHERAYQNANYPIDPSVSEVRIHDLVMNRRAMIRGRIVNMQGNPVVPSDNLLFWQTEKFPGFEEASYSLAFWGGHYEIPNFSSGLGRVYAYSAEHGVGLAAFHGVRNGEDFQAPDLVLRPFQSLAGVVRYPDGTPIAGLTIAAKSTTPGPVNRDTPETLTGVNGSRTRTDKDGRFCMRGLNPGSYKLSAKESEYGKGKSLEIEGEDVLDSGNESIDLRVRVQRLLVRALDRDNRIVPTAEFSLEIWHNAQDFQELRQRLRENPGDLRSVIEKQNRPDSSTSGNGDWGEFRHTVSGGDLILVGVKAEGASSALQLVEIEPDEFETKVDLYLTAAPKKFASLRFSVVDPQGQPVTLHFLTLRYKDALSETVQGFYDQTNVEQPIRLVPGNYELCLTFGSRFKAPASHEDFLLPIEHKFSVETEKEMDLRLKARLGGKIRALLTLAPFDTAKDPELDKEQSGFKLRYRKSSESVWNNRYSFLYEDSKVLGGFDFGEDGPALSHEWRPGIALLMSEPLEPGLYVFRAECPGFRPQDIPVTVEPGKIIDIAFSPMRE